MSKNLISACFLKFYWDRAIPRNCGYIPSNLLVMLVSLKKVSTFKWIQIYFFGVFAHSGTGTSQKRGNKAENLPTANFPKIQSLLLSLLSAILLFSEFRQQFPMYSNIKHECSNSFYHQTFRNNDVKIIYSYKTYKHSCFYTH